MAKIGVILSGSGVYDGSEIHEAVLTLLALDQAGVEMACFAPDAQQHHVINHLTGEAMQETRNILIESARIARGKIQPLSEANEQELDAVVFPGGFGAAKNLCTFAFKGDQSTVHPEVERIIGDMHRAGKPIGMACIAPAIGARVLGEAGVELTIGNDSGTAAALESMGAKHVDREVTEIHIDERNNVISTPAYMYDERISNVAKGIAKMVEAVVDRVRQPAGRDRR